MKDKSVAILYVCTGKYVVFWKDFYLSCEKYFLNDGYTIDYFVFTDTDSVFDSDKNEKIHLIYQDNLGWPGNTLMRYDMFWKQKDLLVHYDYIYFMNSNAEIVCKITADDILPKHDNEIVVVRHPGTLKTQKYLLPFERNKRSTAYVSYNDGNIYVAGGINGGSSKAFLTMTEVLKQRVNDDLANNIVAIWHDESQINRYVTYDTESRVLNSSFCYPEGWSIPFEKKILIREKSRYIDVNRIKKNKMQILLQGAKRHLICVCLMFRDMFAGR